MARLPPVVVHEAGLRVRRGDGLVLYANGNEPHCSLVGPFAPRGPFQDVGKAAGSNMWERPVVRCCVVDGIPIWSEMLVGWPEGWLPADRPETRQSKEGGGGGGR